MCLLPFIIHAEMLCYGADIMQNYVKANRWQFIIDSFANKYSLCYTKSEVCMTVCFLLLKIFSVLYIKGDAGFIINFSMSLFILSVFIPQPHNKAAA